LGGSVELLEERDEAPCIYHLFPIRVADRDALGAELRARGIGNGVHYPVALPDQPWQGPPRDVDVPVARDWAARELSLPMFPSMSAEELDAVCAALADALRATPEPASPVS
jgi:dTDP-4-amino-4,6-dideoxygalactose transaminase